MFKKVIAILLFIWSTIALIGLIGDHSDFGNNSTYTFGVLMGVFLPAIIGIIILLFGKKNIIIKSENTNRNLNLAINLYSENRIEEALGLFNNINRNKKIEYNVTADYFKGLIYFNKQDFVKAKSNFEYVIQNRSYLSNITIAQTYYYLGGIYFNNNKPLLAKECKLMAIALNNLYCDFDLPEFAGYKDL
ncbi:MAG: tetratricopeptide repeat protein [Bacteroidia bacterium]